MQKISPTLLIVFILWGICGSLFCCCSCRFACKYIIRWEDSFIQTRHPHMNLLIILVTLLVEILFQPMSCLGDLEVTKTFQGLQTFVDVSNLLLHISHHFLFFAVLVQFYAFYYDTHCSLASESIGWRELLQSNPSDWYLENKNTLLGNYRYYSRAMFLYIVIQIVISIIVFFVSRQNLIYINIPIIIAFLGICLIAFRRPNFKDKLWVRPQMTYLMISWSLVTVVLVSRVLGSLFIPSGTTKNFFIIAMYVCINITYFLFLWFLLGYPLYKKETNKIITGVNEWKRRQSHTRSLSTQLQLSDTTRDERTLSDFMNHLRSEYAHELLLFLIEYSLYKQYLINKFTIETLRRTLSVTDSNEAPSPDFDTRAHAKAAKSEIYKVELPDVIECEIVSNDTKYEGFKAKGKALYDKYIPNDAKFQLNLSYETSKKLHRSFEPSRIFSSNGYDLILEISRTLSDLLDETNSSSPLLKKKSGSGTAETIKTPREITPRPDSQQKPDIDARSNAGKSRSKESLSNVKMPARASNSSKLTAYLASQMSSDESAAGRDSGLLTTPRGDNRQLSASQVSVGSYLAPIGAKQNTDRGDDPPALDPIRMITPSVGSDDGASVLLDPSQPNEHPSTPMSRHRYKPSESSRTLSGEVEYWTVFDEAAGEVYRLLVLSHIRWARKNQENQV